MDGEQEKTVSTSELLKGTLSHRTHGNEKSGMAMCGCDSLKGTITLDWCNQGRLHEGGDGWAGPHRKNTCCTGGVGPGLWSTPRRAMEAHHSLSLVFSGAPTLS